METINIGILGCADIARRLVIPNLQSLKEFNVVAVASRNLSTAISFCNEFNCEPIEGYQNLINRADIDAVYIPLPTGMHYEWVIKSLHAGKHVFCEKSLAVNYAEVSEIIDLAKKNNCLLFENFMFPYHSQIAYVKQLINDGEIGELRSFRSSFGFPVFNYETNIRYKSELGGGALLDAGAYTLKGAQLFLGNDLKVTSALLNFQGKEVDFFGAVSLVNSNNIPAQLLFGFDNFYQNNIELWGSKGKIVIERAFTAGPGFKPTIVLEKQGKRDVVELPSDNHFISIFKDFYIRILNKEFMYNFEQLLNQAFLLNEIRIYGK